MRKGWIPILGVILALGLRFWHIQAPNQLVSDEVYFVNQGYDYLTGTEYFDPHPPLGKLELGITFSVFGFSPLTWRMLNAVEGTLIIFLLWWITRRLTRSETAAAIVMLLGLTDGLLLVESRLAMINTPYIFYGLVGFAAVLQALTKRKPWLWMTIAGIALGLSLSVKWIALLFVVPALVIWIWPQTIGWLRSDFHILDRLKWVGLSVLIMLTVYWVIFQIHFLWLGLAGNFWSENLRMLDYHLRVPSIGDPKAASVWTWPLLWQPFPYYTSDDTQIQIWSLGNPWMWWTGMVIVAVAALRSWRDKLLRGLILVTLVSWIAFGFVGRIMYSYHMLSMDVYLLFLVGIWLSRQKNHRLVIGYLILAVIFFIWFLPWWLGTSVSVEQQHLRQWLPGWDANKFIPSGA